ncbi:hypothetical protein Zmor_001235 [Zophobas morio]|uniref:Uncharacterized protein n=1 Tax=Zophobas morio TaxID=2755281 RepID=A0AA38J6P4_9CUCU|nr:hypothetical protein Zmor_001235 [Zophobas morio]
MKRTVQPYYIETVNKFIENRLEVKVEIKKASKIRKDIYLIQLENSENKQKIMENKEKLKVVQDDRVHINNDLTKKEREIQTQIRLQAKREREAGKVVKIGFNKLTIDGKTWKWDKTQRRLEPQN